MTPVVVDSKKKKKQKRDEEKLEEETVKDLKDWSDGERIEIEKKLEQLYSE